MRLVAASLLAFSANATYADEISDAVMNDTRSAEAKLRDEYRHPQQTLRFFGIEPDMTVVEIWPGGGWYTDILASLLKENGKLIAAHFFIDDSSPGYQKRYLDSFKDKVKNTDEYSGITVSEFHPDKAQNIADPGSVDAVLTFRNVHNWYMGEGDKSLDGAFSAFFKALKPGGVLGVVDHEMPESGSDEAMKQSGYIKKSVVVNAAKRAGFTLAEESDVNANPMDNADHPKGVWTLPPSLALKDEKRDHYLAIGESNRMTLKFVKPEQK